mmetsp:Transcript_33352/g.93583  ORF Transcript_33352/g.93583 Transcript_33352/m.93583 type:complete len:201 (+) Transcript_33352:1994-2596(+)
MRRAWMRSRSSLTGKRVGRPRMVLLPLPLVRRRSRSGARARRRPRRRGVLGRIRRTCPQTRRGMTRRWWTKRWWLKDWHSRRPQRSLRVMPRGIGWTWRIPRRLRSSCSRCGRVTTCLCGRKTCSMWTTLYSSRHSCKRSWSTAGGGGVPWSIVWRRSLRTRCSSLQRFSAAPACARSLICGSGCCRDTCRQASRPVGTF